MRSCVCGNDLGDDPGFKVTHSPCRCAKPGPGHTAIRRESFLDDIGAKQYAERTRTGLPLVTDHEKSLFRELR